MRILAIETSCDETAIALVECSGSLPDPKFKVLGNSLVSQIHIHKDYGGVYPMLAKREHIKNLPIVLELALKEAGENVENPNINLIAVTAGPGLEPALWTGIEFAKELGKKWSKPIMPVNHMEGHLFSFLFKHSEPIRFPAIALLVSGGHTELIEVESFDSYRIIGRTRDDAVGEAFDKVARLLDLPYPGGPKISILAEMARKRNNDFRASRTATAGEERAFSAENDSALRKSLFRFPRPMLNTDDYDFSYSGLKTAVLYAIKKLGKLTEEDKESIAAEFEEAALEPLVAKTKRALDEFGAQTLIVGGGVSANTYLRNQLEELSSATGVALKLPLPELSTDNAVMIAIAAVIHRLTNRTQTDKPIKAQGNLDL